MLDDPREQLRRDAIRWQAIQDQNWETLAEWARDAGAHQVCELGQKIGEAVKCIEVAEGELDLGAFTRSEAVSVFTLADVALREVYRRALTQATDAAEGR